MLITIKKWASQNFRSVTLTEPPPNRPFLAKIGLFWHQNGFRNAYTGDALQHSLFDRFLIRLRHSAWNYIFRTSCVALFLIFASFAHKCTLNPQKFPKPLFLKFGKILILKLGLFTNEWGKNLKKRDTGCPRNRIPSRTPQTDRKSVK